MKRTLFIFAFLVPLCFAGSRTIECLAEQFRARVSSPKIQEPDLDDAKQMRHADDLVADETIDFSSSFKRLCQHFRATRSGQTSFANDMLTPRKTNRILQMINGGVCAGSLVSAQQVTLAFRKWRAEQRKKGNHSWLVERGSNFVNGFRYMLMADFCAQAIAGKYVRRHLILGSVMTGNALGNFWEEVQLFGDYQKSLPIFSSSGKTVKTDWGDFRSGMYATASYFFMIKAIETSLKLPLAKICAQ